MRRIFDSKPIQTALLLALILAYGGGLRLVGQNWDDYSHTHPDELFLTLLALPHLGGDNNFTQDEINFPRQQIFVQADSQHISSHQDIQNDPALRLGAVAGSFGSQAAGWLAGSGRVIEFATVDDAQNGLSNHAVDALLLHSATPITVDGVVAAQSIVSTDLQQLHCAYKHPGSGGVGPYFDTRCSPLNPHNATQPFFVYGTLPIFLAHFGSEILRAGTDAEWLFFDFLTQHLVWRGISMIFDCLSILAVFLLGRRIHGKRVGLLAALLYASSPLAAQLAHFGTVNSVACFWVVAALYFAVGAQQHGRRGAYWWFGIACGAAVASRINLAPLAGVIVVAAAYQALPALSQSLRRDLRRRVLLQSAVGLILAGLGAFLAFRVLQPYAFAGPGFFDILPNDRWIENMQRVSATVSSPQEFPPNWQWLAKSSLIHPMKDMLFWGMGITFGLLGWFGWSWAAWKLLRLDAGGTRHLLLLVWVGGYHIWMARLFAMTIRYYLPLYGALAVLAGWCLIALWNRAQSSERGPPIAAGLLLTWGALMGAVGCVHALTVTLDATAATAIVLSLILTIVALLPGFRRARVLALGGFTIAFAIIWGLMRAGMYQHQTTLVQGSRYLFERVAGDFSMRVDGADEHTPLINIAFHNTGISLPGYDGKPYHGANHYLEGNRRGQTFIAPASGTISTVHAPHLFDPLDDPEPEHIIVRLTDESGSPATTEAELHAHLPRDRHPLGNAYDFRFDTPLEVSAGTRYSFEIEIAPGSGDVAGSGSVVLVEGDWDNRVTGIHTCDLPPGMTAADDLPAGYYRPNECHGTQAWYALINAVDQIMSYPVDDNIKRDDILRSLEIGDYLTIASNRFYDPQPRNQMRFPLTALYYQKLFAGELGYELVAQFDEPFEWGPWRVSDQHLPTYDSPAWLNELEADEAFHVYDHPAVYIFKKREDYSHARVEAVLSQASLLQRHEVSGDDAGSLGVFYWSLGEAEKAPSALMFTPVEKQTQTQGGTWSERFFSDSLANTNQVFGVMAWYLAIFVIGALIFPLVFACFPKLADGGYGVSKIVGLLLMAWLAWAASSLKIPLWSQAGILLALLLCAALSALLAIRNREALLAFLRARWRRLAWMEVLAIAAFLLMVLVRLTNPDLWHDYKGGEKPMDFAYLNGVLRSTTFPPIDPWFAGGFINYYYFGYVLLGAPTLLLGVVPAFAYNLMIPTLFSSTGMGAFSAAFNIMDRLRRSDGLGEAMRKVRCGSPWVAGVAALTLCVLLGNLDTPRVLGLGLAQLGGYSIPQGLEEFLIDEHLSASDQTMSLETRAELQDRAAQGHIGDRLRYEINNSVSLVRGIARGIGGALTGERLPIGSDRWYWGPSRVLAETPGVGGGAITEMPFFTFVYGDLHAHMINMPLILLTALCLFGELTQAGSDGRRWLERLIALALLALTVSLMQATNTWDYPSMLLFALAGLGYIWWLRWNSVMRPLPDARFYLALIAGLLVIVALLGWVGAGSRGAFLSTQIRAEDIFDAARSALLAVTMLLVAWIALRHWLVRASALDLAGRIGGFLLLVWAFALPYSSWYAGSYDSVQLWQGGKTPLWAYFDIHGLFLFLIVSLLVWDTAHWLRNTRVGSLQAQWHQLRWALAGTAGTLLLAIALTLAGYQAALAALPLVCWIVWLFFRAGQSRAMRFALVLAGLALSMTLGVEVVVIGGDIGRQNTVFKFYIQAWLLLSVSCGVAFACLLRASDRFSPALRALWAAPCIALFVIAGLFPILATRARSFDRMAPNTPLTLNGLDYMRHATHTQFPEDGSLPRRIPLATDHALIRWLQENVDGTPVIMEGRHMPSEYQYNGRISIATGLPSVLGWNFHQRQQRTLFPMHDLVNQREKNIRHFYTSGDIDSAVDILHHHEVKYIIVSDFEIMHASREGLAKFQRMVDRGLLTVAYAIDKGTIYKTQATALIDYKAERYR